MPGGKSLAGKGTHVTSLTFPTASRESNYLFCRNRFSSASCANCDAIASHRGLSEQPKRIRRRYLTSNRMERKRAELSLALENNLHRDGKYMHIWDVEGAVMADRQVMPDESAEDLEARQVAYREQIQRQTGSTIQIH